MRLYKIGHRQRDAELQAQIGDSFGLVLAASIGEKDEGDVVIMQELKCFARPRNRLGHVEKDSVDTIDRKKRVKTLA